jgi:hypothetical protein
VGVIGLTSPNSHRYSRAPAPAADWPDRVQALAGELRGDGARWVVARRYGLKTTLKAPSSFF